MTWIGGNRVVSAAPAVVSDCWPDAASAKTRAASAAAIRVDTVMNSVTARGNFVRWIECRGQSAGPGVGWRSELVDA